MSFFIFLTIIQALVAAALVGVILIQKSEGGGLGMGGSPTGFMSARGAADFLTRATTVLASLFVGLSIVMAGLAVNSGGGHTVDTSLDRTVPQAPVAAPAPAPVPTASVPADPLAATQSPAQKQADAVPAPASTVPADPLKGAAKP